MCVPGEGMWQAVMTHSEGLTLLDAACEDAAVDSASQTDSRALNGQLLWLHAPTYDQVGGASVWYICCLVMIESDSFVTPWTIARQSFVHGIFQWIAICFSRHFSQSRD